MSKVIKFPATPAKNKDLSLYTEGELRERIIEKLEKIKRHAIRSDDIVMLDFIDFATQSLLEDLNQK